jgi:hypothetical protein
MVKSIVFHLVTFKKEIIDKVNIDFYQHVQYGTSIGICHVLFISFSPILNDFLQVHF